MTKPNFKNWHKEYNAEFERLQHKSVDEVMSRFPQDARDGLQGLIKKEFDEGNSPQEAVLKLCEALGITGVCDPLISDESASRMTEFTPVAGAYVHGLSDEELQVITMICLARHCEVFGPIQAIQKMANAMGMIISNEKVDCDMAIKVFLGAVAGMIAEIETKRPIH